MRRSTDNGVLGQDGALRGSKDCLKLKAWQNSLARCMDLLVTGNSLWAVDITPQARTCGNPGCTTTRLQGRPRQKNNVHEATRIARQGLRRSKVPTADTHVQPSCQGATIQRRAALSIRPEAADRVPSPVGARWRVGAQGMDTMYASAVWARWTRGTLIGLYVWAPLPFSRFHSGTCRRGCWSHLCLRGVMAGPGCV